MIIEDLYTSSELFGKTDTIITHEFGRDKDEILYPPGPTPFLLILNAHSIRQAAADSYIHEYRDLKRISPIVAVILDEALPENKRIVGYEVHRPVIYLD